MCPYKDQSPFSNSDASDIEIYEVDTEPEMADSDDSDLTDSDMSSDHDGEEGDTLQSPDSPDSSDEPGDPIAVELPSEYAELGAGREDNVDDDEVVQAILRAREKHSNHPPDIQCEDSVVISFHPAEDIIAAGTFTGDVILYKYSDESNELTSTMELHLKAIRDIEFSDDGQTLFSCSKDKSVMLSSVETGKLVRVYEKAHEDPIESVYVIDDNLFASGCDSGYVKLWDKRREQPVFSLRVMEDYVNAMVTTEQKRHLVVASGGTITSINLHARKIQVQSEEYEHDLTCMSLFRQETKLLVGSSKGTMYLYNWGEFGYHSDEFTELKQNINCLLPISETVAVTGCEDGNIRATHLFPHKHLGIVGQHQFSVESLDISQNGSLIASVDGDGTVIKFWNIKYFEETEVACRKSNRKKELKNNLPSSGYRNAGEFFSDLASSS